MRWMTTFRKLPIIAPRTAMNAQAMGNGTSMTFSIAVRIIPGDDCSAAGDPLPTEFFETWGKDATLTTNVRCALLRSAAPKNCLPARQRRAYRCLWGRKCEFIVICIPRLSWFFRVPDYAVTPNLAIKVGSIFGW